MAARLSIRPLATTDTAPLVAERQRRTLEKNLALVDFFHVKKTKHETDDKESVLVVNNEFHRLV